MAGPASRVSRVVMTGPLAPLAGVYERELRRRRYTPLTVVNQLRQVARLSHWLQTNGLAVAELTGEGVEEFLAFQRPAGDTARSGRVRGCCACWMCCGGWGALDPTGCRCPRMWVARSPPICSAAGRGASDERCSCGPGLRSGRSHRAPSPRPCAGRADGRGWRR